MNVVGKVGSLISQGVYSVATPFHPFGGAVDIIVVRQPDGTFRSTPWYVRFGKFQGVLKGAEKVVRITVNGIEADFHMYLDNSGQAYFLKEVESGKRFETNGDLKDSDGEVVSDSWVAQLRDECDATNQKQLERAESDTRFYDFQDDQFSQEGLVNFSEYGSNRYEGLDSECFGEAQGLDSVVFFSEDGHILTAPVLASDRSAENVQLSTPLFHIGAGEGPDFCDDNGEFSPGGNESDADYIGKLNAAAPKNSSDIVCSLDNDSTALRHHLEVCEKGGEHACQTEETRNLFKHENEFIRQSDIEDASVHIKDDVFKSCLELSELGRHDENANSEEIDSPLQAQISQDKPSCSPPEVGETENGAIGGSRNKDVLSSSCSPNPNYSNENGSPDLPVEKTMLATDNMGSNNASVDLVVNDPELRDEQFNTSAATEGMNSSLQSPPPEDKSSISETVETETSCAKEIDVRASLGFEISLCGNELYVGMGSDAAAEVFESHRISMEEYKNNAMSIIKNTNLIIRFGEMYFTWEKAAPVVLGMAAFGLELAIEPQDAIPIEKDESSKPKGGASGVTSAPSGRRWRLWSIPLKRVKTLEKTGSNLSSEEVFLDTESSLQNSPEDLIPTSSGRIESPGKQFVRTNIPTNEQIASLNLKNGQNMITFSFSSRVLGIQQVEAHLYLWKWNAKIVISDVDGTITKSDVLGQFMPLVGRDWTQSGVANLFSAIKENGYQLLFLSARAIVQAYLTRSFLLNLKQDGKALPSGPVVISPDGLFPSLYREVIRRTPHEFKIACLKNIRKLFPSDYNPFYAGFGNRDTDELSYKEIGIPKGKRFIINPKGEVAVSYCMNTRSYTSLHTLVEEMFPPTSSIEPEDYNEWNFWKVPLQDIE